MVFDRRAIGFELAALAVAVLTAGGFAKAQASRGPLLEGRVAGYDYRVLQGGENTRPESRLTIAVPGVGGAENPCYVEVNDVNMREGRTKESLLLALRSPNAYLEELEGARMKECIPGNVFTVSAGQVRISQRDATETAYAP